MKTITMDYDDFVMLEGSLKALKDRREQEQKLTDEFLAGLNQAELQEIRTNVKHPLWTAADRQLQLRDANTALFKGKK